MSNQHLEQMATHLEEHAQLHEYILEQVIQNGPTTQTPPFGSLRSLLHGLPSEFNFWQVTSLLKAQHHQKHIDASAMAQYAQTHLLRWPADDAMTQLTPSFRDPATPWSRGLIIDASQWHATTLREHLAEIAPRCTILDYIYLTQYTHEHLEIICGAPWARPLKHLWLSKEKETDATSHPLMMHAQYIKHIASLHLDIELDTSTLVEIINHCDKLQALKLGMASTLHWDRVLIHCDLSTLQWLDLENQNLGNRHLWTSRNKLQNLQHLRLHKCGLEDEDLLALRDAPFAPTLLSLCVSHNNFTDRGLQRVFGANATQTFTDQMTLFGGAPTQQKQPWQALQWLDLQLSINTYDSKSKRGFLAHATQMTSLEHLNLSDQIEAYGATILRHFPHLHRLKEVILQYHDSDKAYDDLMGTPLMPDPWRDAREDLAAWQSALQQGARSWFGQLEVLNAQGPEQNAVPVLNALRHATHLRLRYLAVSYETYPYNAQHMLDAIDGLADCGHLQSLHELSLGEIDGQTSWGLLLMDIPHLKNCVVVGVWGDHRIDAPKATPGRGELTQRLHITRHQHARLRFRQRAYTLGLHGNDIDGLYYATPSTFELQNIWTFDGLMTFEKELQDSIDHTQDPATKEALLKNLKEIHLPLKQMYLNKINLDRQWQSLAQVAERAMEDER